MSKIMFAVPPISHFFWDFDGCFCDSESVHKTAYTLAFREYGHSLNGESYFEIFTHTGAGPKYIIDKFKLNVEEQTIRTAKNKFYMDLILKHKARIYKEIPLILKELERLKIKSYIVTNSPEHEIQTILNQQPEKITIEKIVTPKNGIRKKPYPDIYLKTLELANIEPKNALVIEDSERGLLAAQSAHISALWISTENSELFESHAAYLKKMTHAELLRELKNVDG